MNPFEELHREVQNHASLKGTEFHLRGAAYGSKIQIEYVNGYGSVYMRADRSKGGYDNLRLGYKVNGSERVSIDADSDMAFDGLPLNDRLVEILEKI